MCAKLELLVEDSKNQAKHALDGALNLVQHDCVSFIGAWASGPTMKVSTFLSIPSINRAIIGPSQTSPQLSESRFSNFLRTPPSDDVAANHMAELMKGVCVCLLLFTDMC